MKDYSIQTYFDSIQIYFLWMNKDMIFKWKIKPDGNEKWLNTNIFWLNTNVFSLNDKMLT